MKIKLLSILLLLNLGAFATVTSVTSLGDAGAGSLRDIILNANAGDTIDFSVAGTITLTGGEISISQNLVILSSGSANLTLSGNSANRIFNISAGKVYINSVSFENGVFTGSAGAVKNSSTDTVTFDKCVFNFCSATADGGAIHHDGAMLSMLECTITNNNANNDGGGLFINSGDVLISNSTFNGNTSGNAGAGIKVLSGTCTMINSTLSGNTAIGPGGGFDGTILSTNCTITGNSASDGGGANSANAEFQNCIIYNNTAAGSSPDLIGAIISNENNLVGDTTGSTGFLPSDIIGLDPMLDVLGFNGGFTTTHALMSSSPCIDAGFCRSAPRMDQRETPRVGYPDIGAYEFGGTAFVTNMVSQSICAGTQLSFGTLTLDTAGTYSQVFLSTESCDSTVELTLSLLSTYNETATDMICQGDSLTFGTQTIYIGGVYTELFSSVLSCDSSVELTLTVISPDLTVVQSGKTLNATATATSYQWLDCSTNQIIPNDTNQLFIATANGQYAVIITENGCTDTSACYPVTTVGISQNTFTDFVNVFPTDASDYVNVEFKAVNKITTLKIIDVLGKNVFQENYSDTKNIRIDITDLKPGNYFLQIETEENSSSHRFLKIN